MDDDDAPPMLVDSEGKVDEAEASLNAEMEDVQVTKVPISIITGERIVFLISGHRMVLRCAGSNVTSDHETNLPWRLGKSHSTVTLDDWAARNSTERHGRLEGMGRWKAPANRSYSQATSEPANPLFSTTSSQLAMERRSP